MDKGFQGIKNIVPPEQVEIPHKKPKGKSLSTEQKQENNVISSFRMLSLAETFNSPVHVIDIRNVMNIYIPNPIILGLKHHLDPQVI